MKHKNSLLILPAAAYTILLIMFSSASLESAKSALKLCAYSLIPSLFPFFVCSNLLINLGAAELLSKLFNPIMKPLFGLSGSCSLPMILGYISGYPIGAKTAADLYLEGGCSKSEAEKLLAFCNNSGPMFIIGALGSGMLGNPKAGVIIYISHVLSSLITAFIMRGVSVSTLSKNRKNHKSTSENFGELLGNAISSSVLLTFNVCGFVVIFATLISFIEKLGIINALASLGTEPALIKALIYGVLECSGGCDAVISVFKSPLACLMLLSSVVSWSGISVHLQVLGIIKKANLSPKLYFKGKALSAIISPFITFLIYCILKGSVKPLPLVKIIFLFVVTVFVILKIFSTLKRFYFKYLALPPR